MSVCDRDELREERELAEFKRSLGMNPIAVMQSLYVVYGRPAWSAAFLIACINNSGLFSTPLRYEFSGTGDDHGCVAWVLDRSGQRLDSTRVTIGMAKKEGWYSKSGSKWQTMPEQMLRYRSASFFARAYCPELTMGMQTRDEIIDVESVPASASQRKAAKPTVQSTLANIIPPKDAVIDVEPADDEAEMSLFDQISGEIKTAKARSAFTRLGNEIAAAAREGKLTEEQTEELNQALKDRVESL